MAEITATEIGSGLQQAAEPCCWYPEGADGYAFEWGGGSPHWASEAEGIGGIESIFKQYDEDENKRPAITLRREEAPCWHLTCDECGYRYDEDEWITHFPGRADAEAAAVDSEWVLRDGRYLCLVCADEPTPPASVPHPAAADPSDGGGGS